MIAYVDGMLNFSKTKEEKLRHIKFILQGLKEDK